MATNCVKHFGEWGMERGGEGFWRRKNRVRSSSKSFR